MSTSTRRVVVDDTDPRISYSSSPSWFAIADPMPDVGNFGPTYNSTQHGMHSSGSFEFTFTGTQVFVFGTTHIQNATNAAGHTPTWECFIDNASVGATKPFQFPENNWPLCSARGLSDGKHTLRVEANSTDGAIFYFDYLRYAPSNGVPLDNESIMVNNVDPAIRYGPGWVPLGDTANMTTVQGSSFEFEFVGTALSWYGFIPKELPTKSATGIYSVDDGTPTTFVLQGLGPGSNLVSVYNQQFFRTPTLPYGRHNVSVIFNGATGQTTPLTLDYLIIQNGTQTSTATVLATVTPTPPAPSASEGTSFNGIAIGGIVGGVIGAILLITLAIFGFFIWKKMKVKRRREYDPKTSIPIPFTARRNSATEASVSSSQPFVMTPRYQNSPNEGPAVLPTIFDHTRGVSTPPPGTGTPQPLTFENLRSLDPNARVIETSPSPPPPPMHYMPENSQPISPAPYRTTGANHQRKRSNAQPMAGPSRAQPVTSPNRDTFPPPVELAELGGYQSQTRYQTKAMEAAAERKKNKARDSYF